MREFIIKFKSLLFIAFIMYTKYNTNRNYALYICNGFLLFYYNKNEKPKFILPNMPTPTSASLIILQSLLPSPIARVTIFALTLTMLTS